MDLVGVAQEYVLLGFMCLCCDQWVPGNSATVHMPPCSGETMKQASLPQQLLAGLAYRTETAVRLPHRHCWNSSGLCQCVQLVRIDVQI